MVAVGNLDKIWLSVSDDVPMGELSNAFSDNFGLAWDEVLNTAEASLAYKALNNIFFAVRDLRPVENLTLDQLLPKTGIKKPPNVIVS